MLPKGCARFVRPEEPVPLQFGHDRPAERLEQSREMGWCDEEAAACSGLETMRRFRTAPAADGPMRGPALETGKQMHLSLPGSAHTRNLPRGRLRAIIVQPKLIARNL